MMKRFSRATASAITCVLLAHQVRKRIQLLQTGIYVGAVTLLLGMLLGRQSADLDRFERPAQLAAQSLESHRSAEQHVAGHGFLP